MYIGAKVINSCSSKGLASILLVTKRILGLIQMLAPILLIIALLISFTKLTRDPDEKKYKAQLKNEIMALLFVFAVPVIINATMLILNDTFSFTACWNSVEDYSTDSSYTDTSDKSKNKLTVDSSDYDDGENNSNSSSNNNGSQITATGKGNFVKYNLSESQLKAITALAIHEQGSAKGAAAEASLMANRFELYGSKYGSGADGLVNYVKKSGWFAHAAKNMADTKIITSSALDAVKKVLIEGKRTLPGYVDEHDCFSDISSISTGSVKDRSAYKQFVTKIHNRYGAKYTFYSFPDTKSDPFGYTSEEKRKKIGDDCYSFEG